MQGAVKDQSRDEGKWGLKAKTHQSDDQLVNLIWK